MKDCPKGHVAAESPSVREAILDQLRSESGAWWERALLASYVKKKWGVP